MPHYVPMTHRLKSGVSIVCMMWLTGCGVERVVESTAPVHGSAPLASNAANPGTGSLFYPLEVGNTWHYSRTWSIQFWLDGQPEPQEPEVYPSTIVRRITGEQDVNGVTYRVEEEVQRWDYFGGGEVTHCHMLRQDRAGLYLNDTEVLSCTEAPWPPDLAATTTTSTASARSFNPEDTIPLKAFLTRTGAADQTGTRLALERLLARRQKIRQALGPLVRGSFAPRGAGGALPGDAPLLQYPLNTGAFWIMRPENEPFLITRRVDGRESLDLPFGRVAAWRMDHQLPGLLGPEDEVWFWYSRQGLVRFELSITEEWTTVFGRQGIFYGRDIETLESFDLVGRP